MLDEDPGPCGLVEPTRQRRTRAKERARRLLEESLSIDQFRDLIAVGYFTVRVNGRTYRIYQGRVRNVRQVDEQGRELAVFCAHPADPVPDEDTMLAQKLWLQSDEEGFLRIANRSTPPPDRVTQNEQQQI